MAVAHADAGQRKEILRNHQVTVSRLETGAAREATPLHRHDRDMLAVLVDGGRTRNTVSGAHLEAAKFPIQKSSASFSL
jgi:hypothetical protein